MRKALELDPLGADTRELLDKLTHEISQQHALGNRGNGARVGAGSNGRPQAQARTQPAQLSNHGPNQPQGRYVPFETDASARTFQLPEQQFQQQVRTYLSRPPGIVPSEKSVPCRQLATQPHAASGQLQQQQLLLQAQQQQFPRPDGSGIKRPHSATTSLSSTSGGRSGGGRGKSGFDSDDELDTSNWSRKDQESLQQIESMLNSGTLDPEQTKTLKKQRR